MVWMWCPLVGSVPVPDPTRWLGFQPHSASDARTWASLWVVRQRGRHMLWSLRRNLQMLCDHLLVMLAWFWLLKGFVFPFLFVSLQQCRLCASFLVRFFWLLFAVNTANSFFMFLVLSPCFSNMSLVFRGRPVSDQLCVFLVRCLLGIIFSVYVHYVYRKNISLIVFVQWLL
jgi:hypothetical protein